jgi:hypothetical protein
VTLSKLTTINPIVVERKMKSQEKIGKYTSKIIKATALLPDSKLFLSQWNPDFSSEKNIQKFIDYNLLGKTSRAFVKNITSAFKDRYIFRDDQDEALRLLLQSSIDPKVIDRILFYYTAKSDLLIYDFVIKCVYQMYQDGNIEISMERTQKILKQFSDDNKMMSKWSDIVCNRVARNLLTTLRDFHILEGKVKKRISPPYLPLESFVYIAYLIARKEPGGERILQHNDWKLFLLNTRDVEQLFLEAHQRGYLNYYAAGSIIRISFKQKSIIEVVHDLIQ